MRRQRIKPCSRTTGSVLVPVMGAMLILLLCGTALAEAFAAQRHLATVGNESSQAHWIAEAGLWHAASADEAIPAPVDFAGGRYTVNKSGTVFRAQAELGSVSAVLSRDFEGVFASGTDTSPLDIPATEDTARITSNDSLAVDLVNESGEQLLIEAFELSANVPHPDLHRMRIEGWEIVHAHSNNSLPTGYWPTPWGVFLGLFFDPALPLILFVEFRDKPTGSVDYTLVLHFSGADSATLQFTLDW